MKDASFIAGLLSTAMVLSSCNLLNGETQTQTEIKVSVNPSELSLSTGASQAFSCTVTGTSVTGCTWSVQEGPTGGSVTANGLYTAPSTAGTYHVVAASRAESSRTATAAITVTAPSGSVAIAVSPTTAALSTGGSQTFTCTVTGSSDTGCTWSVQEGSTGGSVTSAGVYTAPATAGTSHIVAASHADPTKKATATITVTSSSDKNDGKNDVTVSMDSSNGTKPISPFIFGANVMPDMMPTHRGIATMWRAGGNRLTGYNWETNYSNAGSDYGPYSNDTHLVGDGKPGAPYRFAADVFNRSGTWASAALFTMPTIGYVAGTWTGKATPVIVSDLVTIAGPTVGSGTSSDTWRRSLPSRSGDPAHALATATPDLTDDSVYQDDLLAWLKANYGAHLSSATAPLWIALDNEPDLWGSTHAEIRGKSPSQHVQVGYDELVTNNSTYAAAVKAVLGPSALVFGPVSFGWMGYTSAGNVEADGNGAKPPSGYDWFLGYYLKKMNDASTSAGKRLLDVLDIHWYPEASSTTTGDRILNNDSTQDAATIVAREQAPRSLWDPSYLEKSWISHWGAYIPGCTPAGDPAKCSIKLLPNLKQMIDSYYPGTKLGITEWGYGREMDVSNAIASADVLGIFAREGVYAASTWPGGGADGCVGAAFRAYLDYDGSMSHFGDTFIPTTVSDPSRPVDTYLSGTSRGDGTTVPTQYLERVTAYASFDAATPGRVVVVAINKDLSSTLNVGFTIKHSATFKTAQVYRVTGQNGGSGGCTGPTPQADISLTATNAFNAGLPPQSVTVFVLKP